MNRMKKMIIKILLVLSILLLSVSTLCLAGCSDNTDVNKSNNTNVKFWTDKDTGVQYVIYDESEGYAGMGGITPRLNSDGSLYIAE